ncbi:MAG: FHA domain-containing protein, partial [Isosphaeraceae bacterium]|nr:FHA domain-containing protein [Isosphaeraceae bacterium]
MTLRIHEPSASSPREVVVARPYALIGRITGADIVIDDRAVSTRHAYLHLDRRGLFVVDLATRTGTRLGTTRRPAGWLRPGEALEIAGRRIELADARVDGQPPAGPGAGDPSDPLADAGAGALPRVTLYPAAPPPAPQVHR